jgi:hypothetical protein
VKIRPIKVHCEKCNIDYYYVPPPDYIGYFATPPGTIFTKDEKLAEDRIKNIMEKKIGSYGSYRARQEYEGSIYCIECKKVYKFKYRFDNK